jgi:predicted phosphodiesterase
MTKLTKLAAFVAGAFAVSSSLPTVAAELIQTPDRTVLRSLTDWEQAGGLQVFRGGIWQTQPVRDRVVNVDLGDADFCSDARYKVMKTGQSAADEISLDHLCDGGRLTSFDFLFISDTQENHDANAQTAAHIVSMIDENPGLRFIVTGGDIVHQGSETEWKAYRDVAQTYTARLPIVPVIGNHEYKGDQGLALFEKVYATAETVRGYYMISHRVANLIVLNSNTTEMTKADRKAQDAWMKAAVQQTKADGKKAIVTFHHAPYTSGFGVLYMPTNPHYIRSHWVPVFEEFGVDLVLVGHEHLFERIVRNGVTWLVAGPAAGKFSPRRPNAPQGSLLVLPNKRTVTKVSVTKAGIELITVEPGSGDVLDRATIE